MNSLHILPFHQRSQNIHQIYPILGTQVHTPTITWEESPCYARFANIDVEAKAV